MSLRGRLRLSSVLTTLYMFIFLATIVAERLDFSRQFELAANHETAARQARELSLYTQNMAYTTNAYALGHLPHRARFDEYTDAFAQAADSLQQQLVAAEFDPSTRQRLDRVVQIQHQYRREAQQLFVAAYTNWTSPSVEHQAEMDTVWERADLLLNQLDTESRQLAQTLHADSQQRQARLQQRNTWMLLGVVGFGGLVLGFVILVQWQTAKALGKPLEVLLAGIKRFAAGDLSARAPIARPDEIGSLTDAFNTMASTIEDQRRNLVQLEVADAARAEAEAAHQRIAAQFATIEEQRRVIQMMEVPILPLTDQIMVMPLVGALDTNRLQVLQERALHTIQTAAARALLIDITGVPMVDTQVAQGLIRVAQAAALLGTRTIVVGIRPDVAQTLVSLGVNLASIATRSTLQSGLHYALQDQPDGIRRAVHSHNVKGSDR